MKVLVLGSSGIIGQHMRLCVPDDVIVTWHRRISDALHIGSDLTDPGELIALLRGVDADVVVNLAGQSSPDAVEAEPIRWAALNVGVPEMIAEWCQRNSKRLIQVSTQAVFGGDKPPYGPGSICSPVNVYGVQKRRAEMDVLEYPCAIVARPTFCLGVRPLPRVGRSNPVELILAGQPKQVADRWFSVAFASDVARTLWHFVRFGSPNARIVHIGSESRLNRLTLAKMLGADPIPVSHDDFPGIAPRPWDTTYASGSSWQWTPLADGIKTCIAEWESMNSDDLAYRAKQIAVFFGISDARALATLNQGFGALHNAVADDYRKVNPQGDEALLRWYRTTDAYIWELSAYHCDERFNYAGMCDGLAGRLTTLDAKRVLVLGDGIGDITGALRARGIDATYHDLAGSRTAEFAQFRYWAKTNETLPTLLSDGWTPNLGEGWDAIVSFDFLEHVTDVPAWAAAIRNALVPGGRLFVQNAFNCGSGDRGSIPMHLACNDRFEKDWDPLMAQIGMEQESSNWYRRAA